MRIGEALAEARGRAGLTVAEVSQRTRIKEAIVREIEDDDFSSCGGDFYTRGNIRSIAKAVGADPEPLIREYDQVHRAHGVLSAVSLDELLAPVQAPRRRRLGWTVVLGLSLVVALGFVGYEVLLGSPHAGSPPAAANHAVSHAAGSRTPPTLKTGRSAALSVGLTASRSCWVVFTAPGGKHRIRSHVAAGTSARWTFRHAVDLRLVDPSSVTLTVDGKNPLPSGPVSRPVTLILRPGHPADVAVRTLTGPVATLRAYVAAINDHHYAWAWRLGGRNAGGSYASFVSGFSTTAKDTLTGVSVSGDVVSARLIARQTDHTVNTYEGTYTVEKGEIVGFDVLQVG